MKESTNKVDRRERQLRLRAVHAYTFVSGNMICAMLLAFILDQRVIAVCSGFLVLLYGVIDSRKSIISVTTLDADPNGAKRVIRFGYPLMALYMLIGCLMPADTRRSMASIAFPLGLVFVYFSPAFRGTLDQIVKDLMKVTIDSKPFNRIG